MASAILGLTLIINTLMIHALGMAVLAFVLIRIRQRIEQQRRRLPPLFAPIITAVGLVLLLLHAIEVALWAVAYRMLGAFASWPEAWFYSLDSFTTRGESGLVLPVPWQALGAIEAANGVLLFGLTTAFMFSVMQVWWPMYMRRFDHEAKVKAASFRQPPDFYSSAAWFIAWCFAASPWW